MCLFALLPSSSIVSPSWINSLFPPNITAVLLLLHLSTHQWNNSPSRVQEAPRAAQRLARHLSQQHQCLGSPHIKGGCSKSLHLLHQRKRGTAPGWQCLLLEQQQTSLQSWGSCNCGITGDSVVLLILPDQSSTPEMTASFLLCCRSQRVCCCWETREYGGGSAELPWVWKSCDSLTHAYELHYDRLYLFCRDTHKLIPNTMELCPSTKIFAPTLASAYSLLKLLFVTLSLGLIMSSSPCWLFALLQTGSGAQQPGPAPWQPCGSKLLPDYPPVLRRAHTGFDLFS